MILLADLVDGLPIWSVIEDTMLLRILLYLILRAIMLSLLLFLFLLVSTVQIIHLNGGLELVYAFRVIVDIIIIII